MGTKITRENDEPIDFEPIGYLDISGMNDSFLIGLLQDHHDMGTKHDEIARILDDLKYATSALNKRKITGSNVSQFLLKRMGLRRHKEHSKRFYKHNSIVTVKGLKEKGEYEKIQIAKAISPDYSHRLGIQLIENANGRSTEMSEKQWLEKKENSKKWSEMYGDHSNKNI